MSDFRDMPAPVVRAMENMARRIRQLGRGVHYIGVICDDNGVREVFVVKSLKLEKVRPDLTE